MDAVIERTAQQVRQALAGATVRPEVVTFFDAPTFTASHLVIDPATRTAAIIDSVLDYDPAAGRTSTASADVVIAEVERRGLTVAWHLETHIHADHLSAAAHLQQKLGGQMAVGSQVCTVQQTFAKIFNAPPSFAVDGSQFDRLFEDGDRFKIGELSCVVLYVPGHTPADIAYVIGDSAFIGDTMFMPDYGTARADFPGGDARQLYHSARRLLSLPDETKLYLCHDYKAPGRDAFVWQTTVAAQRRGNIHVHDGISEEDFVHMRTSRDRTLDMPRLILPSVQVNMRAGHLPEPEDNGVSYLKIPLNAL